jgi:hypothetical protein
MKEVGLFFFFLVSPSSNLLSPFSFFPADILLSFWTKFPDFACFAYIIRALGIIMTFQGCTSIVWAHQQVCFGP